jgi:hypothetical protein
VENTVRGEELRERGGQAERRTSGEEGEWTRGGQVETRRASGEEGEWTRGGEWRRRRAGRVKRRASGEG